MANSWKPEVFVGNAWSANGLRFATKGEAMSCANDLMIRWTLVDDTRATASEDPVSHAWQDGVGLTNVAAVSA